MPTIKNNPVPLEVEEQEAVLEYCEIWHMPHFHVNNEMYTTSWKQKATAKRLGTKSGVPDLFVFVPVAKADITGEAIYQMITIEMKRRKGSTTSDTQVEWGRVFTQAAIPHAVCKGATEAIAFIKFCKTHYSKHWKKQRDLADSLMETLTEQLTEEGKK